MTWALKWLHTFRYARYFVKYVRGMGAVGIIQLAAVTVGNEPLSEKNTPSMHRRARNFADRPGHFFRRQIRS